MQHRTFHRAAFAAFLILAVTAAPAVPASAQATRFEVTFPPPRIPAR